MLRRFVLSLLLTGSLVATPAAFVFAQQDMGISADTAQDALRLKVGDMEEQIRSLTDLVERRDFEIRKLRSDLDALQKVIADMPSATAPTPTNANVNAPQIPSDAPPNYDAVDIPVTGDTTDPDAPYSPKSGEAPELGQVVEKPVDGGPVGITSKMSAAKSYDDAYAAFQSGQYAKAEQGFGLFIKTYPDHALAANAQYWQGESQLAQNNFDGAARTFARNFQSYPKGQKAPESLLKLATALDKAGKTPAACLTLREMKTRFADAPASLHARATEDAKRMGCDAVKQPAATPTPSEQSH